MPTKEQIIAALRCKADGPAETKCKGCPYQHIEILTDPKMIKMAGTKKWEICRYEDLFRDAADLLEGQERLNKDYVLTVRDDRDHL